jgi:hypothetical protein
MAARRKSIWRRSANYGSSHISTSLIRCRHVVKRLRCLTVLDVNGGRWTREALLELLANGPHQLQRLRQFNIKMSNIDFELMQAMLTLPSLRVLDPWSIDSQCFLLLPTLAKLCCLRIAPTSDVADMATVAELLSSLRALPELNSLIVAGQRVQSVALQMLVDGLGASVPQLRALTLRSCELSSPHCLSACAQLRSLHLHCCRGSGVQLLRSLLELLPSLRRLEHIQLDGCDPPLTDAQRALLTPYCALVPSLKCFRSI